MPFDGVDFPLRRDPPRRKPPNDDLVILAIVSIAYAALVMPMAIAGYLDVSRLMGVQTAAGPVSSPRPAPAACPGC